MKYIIRIGIPALIILSAIGVSWVMVIMRPEASLKPPEPPTLLVNSFIVQPVDVSIKVIASGTVAPHTETLLVAEITGRIVEVSPVFFSGGFLNKGDVILKIDPRNHMAELKRAEAAMVRAKTQLAQEKSLAIYERGDFEQRRADNPDIAATDLAFRKTQLTRAVAEVVAAEAQLVRANGDLDRTEIRMPYAGLIREKRANLGQYVNPGTPLSVIFAVDFVEVRLPLSAPQVKKLSLPRLRLDGSNAVRVIVTTSDSSKVWAAKLVRTEGVLDLQSRTLYAIARVEDPYGYLFGEEAGEETEPLRVGSFVDVTIPGPTLRQVIPIERHMLKPGNRVWIIDDELRIRPRSVQLAYIDADMAYVSAGLEAGARVCVTPIDNPLPGTRVRIVDEP
ncbi:MAG: efflux RND transporter periplasmic adaptor subunit [bacterium]|nr:efflux RND transporter periplasmic adaptor subunit [Gammaproteobacteria bacterium]